MVSPVIVLNDVLYVVDAGVPMTWVSQLAESWRKRRRRIERGDILCDESGMTVRIKFSDCTEEEFLLLWKDVNGVVAYKRDLVLVDEICLGFSSPDGGVEVNEEMIGWRALIEKLPTYLVGVPPPDHWWDKVVQPPFATNATTLFSR